MSARLVQVLVPLLVVVVLTAGAHGQSANTNRCSQAPNAPHFLYSDANDCTRFFSCSNGVNILQQCPSGLRFSNRYQTCAHPGSFFDTCGTARDTPLTNTSSGSNPGRLPEPAKNQCHTTPTSYPHMYADPDDCNKFFKCAHGLNYPYWCPGALHFSNTLKVCVHPGSAYDTCSVG